MVGREDFLAIERLTETVEVPTLGAVTVRELTQDEYADWVAQWASRQAGELTVDHRIYGASLLQRSIVNGNGELLFTPEDVERLTKLPARVTRPLLQAAERLNGITAEAMRDAKKNSEGGPDGSISTSSPAT